MWPAILTTCRKHFSISTSKNDRLTVMTRASWCLCADLLPQGSSNPRRDVGKMGDYGVHIIIVDILWTRRSVRVVHSNRTSALFVTILPLKIVERLESTDVLHFTRRRSMPPRSRTHTRHRTFVASESLKSTLSEIHEVAHCIVCNSSRCVARGPQSKRMSI